MSQLDPPGLGRVPGVPVPSKVNTGIPLQIELVPAFDAALPGFKLMVNTNRLGPMKMLGLFNFGSAVGIVAPQVVAWAGNCRLVPALVNGWPAQLPPVPVMVLENIVLLAFTRLGSPLALKNAPPNVPPVPFAELLSIVSLINMIWPG